MGKYSSLQPLVETLGEFKVFKIMCGQGRDTDVKTRLTTTLSSILSNPGLLDGYLAGLTP